MACEKNKENNSLVLGSWKWENTFLGIDGSAVSPGADETFILTFKSNGSYLYTKNGAIVRSGNFSVKKFEPLTMRGETWGLFYSDDNYPYFITNNGNELTLVNDVYDGSSHIYSKR